MSVSSRRASSLSASLSPCRRPAAVLALAAMAFAGAAQAEPSAALDRVSLSAGAFYTEPKIHVGADTPQGFVSTPDQELGHVTLPRIKADVLLGDSQGLSLDYFRYDKSNSSTASGSTTYEGVPYAGTVNADLKLQLDLAQLAYKWWIGQGSDVFGVGVGAGYYRAKVDARATGTVSGTVAGLRQSRDFSADGSASESTFAPLLELGWRHAFTPDLRMVADVSGVKKNGGKLSGHIYGASLGAEWFFAKNVGLMADYGIQRIQLSRNGTRDADLKVRLTGPSAYLKVRF